MKNLTKTQFNQILNLKSDLIFKGIDGKVFYNLVYNKYSKTLIHYPKVVEILNQ